MSKPTKLRGGGNSEVTKFKALWRDSLSDSARDFWRALFISQATQAEVRKQLFTKLKINLTRDGQLTDFRKWLDDQDLRDAEAERQYEDERRLTEEHPDWDSERLRTEVLDCAKRRAIATGEFGSAMLRQDLAERRFQFEVQQAAESRKTQQEKALELCLEEAKKFPDVQELFKAAFVALKKAKAAK